MFFRLFLLFTAVPLVELYLLISIGQVIGAMNTILLVLLTGIVGAWLAQREGVRTIGRIQALLANGEMPGKELIDALLILVAGFVLITPGVVTDVLGLLLLFPVTRSVIRNWLAKNFQQRISDQTVTIVYHDSNG